MENETTNEFLKELEQEGSEQSFKEDSNPFKSMDESEDPIPVVEQKEEDKPLPFHKDPKVQRYVEKQIEKALKDVRPTEVQQFVKETEQDEVLSVLERIIGNDTPEKVAATRDLKRVLEGLEEKGAQKAIQKFQADRQAEIEAERQAVRELEEGFESVEESFNVDLTSSTAQARKLNSEFRDFIKKIAPKNSEGEIINYPDFEATFELFQSTRKRPDNSRAKELSTRSLSRSSDTSNVQQPKDTSWNGVSRFIESLGK